MSNSVVTGIKHELRKMKLLAYERLLTDRKQTVSIAEQFHKVYFQAHMYGKTWADTKWLGTPVLKCPFDLWVYQEIFHQTRPDIVIETGSAAGGSAYYFASVFELLG